MAHYHKGGMCTTYAMNPHNSNDSVFNNYSCSKINLVIVSYTAITLGEEDKTRNGNS